MVNLGALLAESALLSYIETGTPDRARLRQARIFFQQAQVFLDQRADQEDGKVALAQCLLYEAISLPPEARLEMVQWAANQTQQLRAALGPSAPGSVRWDIVQRNLAWRDPSFVDWKKIEQARDILVGAGAMAVLVTLAQQWLSTSSGIVEKIQVGPGHHLLPDHPSNSASGHASPSHGIQKDRASRAVEAPSKIEIAKQGIHISRRALLTTGLTVAGLVTTGGLVVVRVFMQNAKSTSVPPLSTQTVAPTLQRDTPLYTYTGHSGGINGVHSVAWSPNNSQRIASTGDDKTVQVWDATTGGNVYTYTGYAGLSGSFGAFAVAWSPTGQNIASGGDDSVVQVWNATTGQRVYTYPGNASRLNAVSWSPDSQRIVSGDTNGTAQAWDATTGDHAYIYRVQPHGTWTNVAVNAVSWSPDGKLIASGCSDGTVEVWSTGQ